MKLNGNKCKTMRVTRSSKQQLSNLYFLNNSALLPVNTYKYLGLHISNNLTWNAHVDYVTNNANRMLGYLRRNFASAPSSLKLTLYKTLVRSKLEYACAVWDPHQTSLVTVLEAIQNRSVRFILSNYSRHASVTTMKTSLHLPALSLRRKCYRLCIFHKMFYHNPILKHALFTRPSYISSRSDHVHKVGVPASRTNMYHDSFIPTTSNDWNHLPASIVDIRDPVRFKITVQNALN